MRVKCIHCGYEWNYKGSNYYATCPRCLRKTKVGGLHASREVQAKETR